MITLFLALFSFQVQAQSLSLNGSWSQGCQIAGDDVIEMNIGVQNDEFAVRGFAFEDADCKVPYIFYEELYHVQSFAPKAARDYDVNLKTKEISYTPLTDEVARALNEGSFCGIDQWKDHVKTVVTGGNCNDEDMKRKGEIYFQSVRLSPDAPTSFYWGLTTHTLDGSSADKRPLNYEALPFFKISRDFNKLM